MSPTPHARGRLLPALITCAVLGAGLLLPLSAWSQWVWRDANGRLVASDIPPPRDVPDRNIVQRPRQAAAPTPGEARPDGTAGAAPAAASAPAPGGAAPAAPGAARPPVDPELEKRRKAAEQSQAAQAKADESRLAEQRRENCARARGHLAGLESGQRMARMNEKGEREILDDKARADEIRRAREVIAADCR